MAEFRRLLLSDDEPSYTMRIASTFSTTPVRGQPPTPISPPVASQWHSSATRWADPSAMTPPPHHLPTPVFPPPLMFPQEMVPHSAPPFAGQPWSFSQFPGWLPPPPPGSYPPPPGAYPPPPRVYSPPPTAPRPLPRILPSSSAIAPPPDLSPAPAPLPLTAPPPRPALQPAPVPAPAQRSETAQPAPVPAPAQRSETALPAPEPAPPRRSIRTLRISLFDLERMSLSEYVRLRAFHAPRERHLMTILRDGLRHRHMCLRRRSARGNPNHRYDLEVFIDLINSLSLSMIPDDPQAVVATRDGLRSLVLSGDAQTGEM